MIRLVLRTCGQVGFEQSEYEYKTVDVSLPDIEALMERHGPGFCIIGAHLVAAQKAKEPGGTASNSDYTALFVDKIDTWLDENLLKGKRGEAVHSLAAQLNSVVKKQNQNCA